MMNKRAAQRNTTLLNVQTGFDAAGGVIQKDDLDL